MSDHTKTHRTNQEEQILVTIKISRHEKRSSYIPLKSLRKLEAFLQENKKEDQKPVAWRVLAKERLEKYKKAGLVLRGARYREGISQKKLAEKTGISQENISKIENGKRTVGEKVAKILAKELNIDYRLFL